MSAYRFTRADPQHDEDHRDLLRDLHTLSFWETAPMPDFEEPGGYWWLVHCGREPVAFCGMREGYTYPTHCYLYRAGVVYSHQGRGLQRRMVRTREALARKLGFRGLVTDTSYDNYRSSNTLIRCGFRLFIPRVRWSFDTQLYWHKEF